MARIFQCPLHWWRLLPPLGLLTGAAGLLAAQGEASRSAPAAELFLPAPLRTVEVLIADAEVEQLDREQRQYVKAVFRAGGLSLTNVGVKLKGAAGSFRGLHDRPALTVSFDKFVNKQRWLGLEKIHLNNSVQDPSRLTENVCGELFRQAGVPAPRVTNVRMQLNGRQLGVYVLIEGFDKTFLKQHFSNANGNLYDGGFCQDIDGNLEQLTGKPSTNRVELLALEDAANLPTRAQRWERFEQLLDMDRFISFCALEIMTWDWDGYVLKPNNYKLYFDASTGKTTFFPHGMDQMFWESHGPIDPSFRGMVARGVLNTPEGERRLQQRMRELLVTVFRADAMTNRLNAYATHVRAAIAERRPSAVEDYDAEVDTVRDRILRRVDFLQKELATQTNSAPGVATGIPPQ